MAMVFQLRAVSGDGEMLFLRINAVTEYVGKQNKLVAGNRSLCGHGIPSVSEGSSLCLLSEKQRPEPSLTPNGTLVARRFVYGQLLESFRFLFALTKESHDD